MSWEVFIFIFIFFSVPQWIKIIIILQVIVIFCFIIYFKIFFCFFLFEIGICQAVRSQQDSLDNITLFSIITIMSFILLAPVSIFMEGINFTPSYLQSAVSKFQESDIATVPFSFLVIHKVTSMINESVIFVIYCILGTEYGTDLQKVSHCRTLLPRISAGEACYMFLLFFCFLKSCLIFLLVPALYFCGCSHLFDSFFPTWTLTK